VIAALAIAVPAFGVSGSIKQAIKKEVAKQISSAASPAGPAGANGSNGSNGANGANGAAGGSSVVVRARGTSTVTAGNGVPPVSYPLTSNTWTQAADELDFHGLIKIGGLVLGTPAGGGCDFMGVSVFVDGTPIDVLQFDTLNTTQEFDIELFEPGAPTLHTVTAELYDNCTTHGSISSMDIDVVGVR
jgi:hypothetical protein